MNIGKDHSKQQKCEKGKMAENCKSNALSSRLGEAQPSIIPTRNSRRAINSTKKSKAEYHREYRARKKAELFRNDEPMFFPVMIESCVLEKKTAADYQREYRARQKFKRLQQAEHGTTLLESIKCESDNFEPVSSVKRRRTNAEKQREYREREKAKRRNILNRFDTTDPSEVVIPSTAAHPLPNEPRRRKTAAQYQREYRARLKSRRMNNSPNSAPLGSTMSAASSSTIADSDDANEDYIQTEVDIDDTKIGLDMKHNLQLPYPEFHLYDIAQNYGKKKIIEKFFTFASMTSNRRRRKQDLKLLANVDEERLDMILPDFAAKIIKSRRTYLKSTWANKILTHAMYAQCTTDLPSLDSITECSISPRVPFVGTRQHGIFGQIVDLPVDVDTMVRCSPRNIDDDYCINFHMKRRRIHKSSWMQGLISKRTVRSWSPQSFSSSRQRQVKCQMMKLMNRLQLRIASSRNRKRYNGRKTNICDSHRGKMIF